MADGKEQILTVAIGGFGAVGRQVGRRLDQGVPGLKLIVIKGTPYLIQAAARCRRENRAQSGIK